MNLPTFADLEHEREERAKFERQLLTALIGATIYLFLVGTSSIVAALVLLGPTKESDLARVAALALCGGAIGGTVRALFAVLEEVQRGVWELADGTIIERSERRAARVRQRFLDERVQAHDSHGSARNRRWLAGPGLPNRPCGGRTFEYEPAPFAESTTASPLAARARFYGPVISPAIARAEPKCPPAGRGSHPDHDRRSGGVQCDPRIECVVMGRRGDGSE